MNKVFKCIVAVSQQIRDIDAEIAEIDAELDGYYKALGVCL